MFYLIEDCAAVRLDSPDGRGAPAGGGEGPLSHGLRRASSPRGGAKYILPNSPDVPQKGNALLPGGQGHPSLREAGSPVVHFQISRWDTIIVNYQLSIVNSINPSLPACFLLEFPLTILPSFGYNIS